MPPRPRNRGWIWFFLFLAVLSIAAISIGVVYNLRQQMTLPALQAAHKQWQEKGPKDYVLEYSKRGSASGRFVATVRQGKVESVIMHQEGEPPDSPGEKLEERLYRYHSMDGLLDDIETFLEMDARPDAPRAYNHADFDTAGDGHLIHFVRSVSKTGQRLEITVLKVQRLPPQ